MKEKELHNLDAEQAVLGSLLIDPGAIREVGHFLEVEHFWKRSHAWIYECVQELTSEGMEPDTVTLADRLEQRELLEEIGGTAYLVHLLGVVPSALRVRDYARIVALRAIDRQIERTAQSIVGVAYKDLPPEEKLAAVQEAVEEITIINGRADAMDAGQGAQVLSQLAEQYAANPLAEGEVRGWATGLVDLDKALRGFKAGLYLVGGVTHVGKTAFVTQLAVNVAREGGRVLLIETEDTHELMWARVGALVSGFGLDDVERGLAGEDLAWYYESLGRISEWDLEIIAKPITVPAVSLEARSRRLDLLVVDNLEAPALAYRGEGEWQRFRGAAYGLLSVAQENAVPLVTTMQVSRHKLADRKSKVPQLEDLYGADGPSQAASVVLTLHRPDVWRVGGIPDNVLEVYCWKDKLSHRGAGNRVVLQFGACGEVRNLAQHAGEDSEAIPF